MVYIKTYIFNKFYEQYLVPLTMVPRNTKYCHSYSLLVDHVPLLDVNILYIYVYLTQDSAPPIRTYFQKPFFFFFPDTCGGSAKAPSDAALVGGNVHLLADKSSPSLHFVLCVVAQT